LEQLEEAVQIIRAMWISQPVTSIGNYYRIRDAYCEPQPSPPIPLLIGGGGELGTLRLVARYADWWNFNSCTTEEYARKAAILKNHCNDVGRDFREIKLTYASWLSITENPSQLKQDSRRHIIAGNASEVLRELKRFHEIGVTHFILKFPNISDLKHFTTDVMPYVE
jgi:alkanesulfonate monooxygenase SsuD/methylene tetrahydromethanopterin reductase-like flavin-dependent oxidoreductase (luciferase family)